MMNNWYRYDLETRRQWLIDTGFSRNAERIWSHPDGRAIGESVAVALTDEAFVRFLGLSLPDEVRLEDSMTQANE
ncbi:MAG TPA: hypothetical protein VEF04_19860 [Blastocatellia bacterium]|nr:hypothetical protein [Blastocatellia bacterium]